MFSNDFFIGNSKHFARGTLQNDGNAGADAQVLGPVKITAGAVQSQVALKNGWLALGGGEQVDTKVKIKILKYFQ